MINLKDKRVLVTGGTGSFGKTVSQYLLSSDVCEVRVLSRDEKKQHDMRLEFNDPRLSLIVGDIREKDSVDESVRGVDYVFHAAALKQVPSCDFYPLQAIYTNILGPRNIINACNKYQVSKAVFLSTDKAVYPINAMGMTKALMEKLVVSQSYMQMNSFNITTFCCTRYGNVMGSRGSVIPFFTNQALSGSDITVTDPEMTRYLMSLDDSVQLVLHAFENGMHGDTFVQKSPACTILDLAVAIKEIVGSKSEIRIIGTRHGEKKHETLVSREEMAKAIDQGRYYRIPADQRGLNYSDYYESGSTDLSTESEYNSEKTYRLNNCEIKDILLSQRFFRELLNV